MGWGEAKIQRWLREQRSAAVRYVPWGDERHFEAKEALLAKYRALMAFGDGKSEFELWLDHPSALAFIDDAESAGLVVFPIEFGHLEYGERQIRAFAHGPGDGVDLYDTHARGGRDAVVRASAQEARRYIKDGFPDGADVAIFAVS
jgi:hypothetical protein